MTKNDGDLPRVMASRAEALTLMRAIMTPRVNVDGGAGVHSVCDDAGPVRGRSVDHGDGGDGRVCSDSALALFCAGRLGGAGLLVGLIALGLRWRCGSRF